MNRKHLTQAEWISPQRLSARVRFCFLFLFFLVGLTALGQLPYLNKATYITPNSSVAFLETADAYYTASPNPLTYDYQYARFDFNGNPLDTLTLVYDSVTTFDNCAKCLQLNNNRLYNVYTNYTYDSLYSYPKEIILSKLYPDLSDTISTSKYSASLGYGSGHAWAMTFDSDSTFLLSGMVAVALPTTQFRYDVLLARFDTTFNLLWETVVPDANPFRVYGNIGSDIVVDSYGSVLVTGSPFFYSPANTGFAARFRQEDGQLLWLKEYHGPYGLSGMYCVDNEDGSYQYVQNWLSGPTGGLNLIKTGRMDTLGNLLDSTFIGQPQRAQFAQDFIRTLDGNYYTAGISYWGNFHSFGLKLTGLGDSLWFRRYWHGNYGFDWSWFENFHQRSDSSYIHCGWHVNGQDSYVYTWFLGSDKYGCDTAGCQSIGLEEFSNNALKVYPNPSMGRFTLLVEEAEPLREVRLQVFNNLGQEVWARKEEVLAGEYAVDLSSQPPGVYHLVLSGRGKEYHGILVRY